MNISEVKEVPIGDIVLQGINVRKDLDTPNSHLLLGELAESIRANGLMQPIVLRGTSDSPPPYDVVVGSRRFLAHQKLGKPTILATFTGEISEIDALAMSLSENLLRQDMNVADTMDAVTKLYVHYGRDERKVKAKLGLSIKSIRRFIHIKEAGTPKIQTMLAEKQISLQDAKRAITAGQGNPEKVDEMIDWLVGGVSKPAKIRASEFAENNPDASFQQISDYASKPRLEPTVIVNLPLKIHKALETAVGQVNQEAEEIMLAALKEWLITNNFLVE